MSSPLFEGCAREKIAIIDGIRKVTTKRPSGIKDYVLTALQCVESLGTALVFAYHVCCIALEVPSVIGARECPGYITIPVEPVKGRHHIVHQDDLSSTLRQVSVLEHL
jgi:hypothetical protein